MTTARSIVCGSCGSDVPYGRLSCPACGDLLASVAGGTRRATRGARTEAAASAGQAVAAVAGGKRAVPSILHDVSEAEDEPSTSSMHASMATLAFDDEPLAAFAPAPSLLEAAPAFEPEPDALVDFDVEAPAAAIESIASVAAPDPEPEADEVAHEPAVEPARELAAEPPASPPPIADGSRAAAWANAAPPPGAYVPPIAGVAVGAPIAAYAGPGGPAAPARSWAGYGAAGADNAVSIDRYIGSEPGSGEAPVVDAARLAEFVGWLAIAGGALAAVGFLLPWGASMIGATGVGYLDRWGLAGPFHLVVALAVVALVVSAIVPNPVPAWIRIGVAGTVLGVFMLGLVWPYVFGFSSTGPGALAVALGAAALLAAGIISLVSDRHARSTPPV